MQELRGRLIDDKKSNEETNVCRENSRLAINSRKQPHAFKIDPSDCTKSIMFQCWRVCGATDAIGSRHGQGPSPIRLTKLVSSKLN